MNVAQTPRNRFPALPLIDRLALLAAAVAVFFAVEARSGRMFVWDSGIGWSYAVIPVLVLAALALRRRLGLLPWFLHTLEIAIGKFGVTAGILLVVLIVGKPHAAAPPAPPVAPPSRVAEPALPDPPAERGRLSGRVLRDGRPARALVYVSAGPPYRWPVGGAPLRLVNDGKGITPALSAAQVGQEVRIAARDHRLHTLLLSQSGTAWRFNVPLLSSGEEAVLRPTGVTGVLDESCTVHGAAERPARLVLVPDPFFQRTGDDGRYAFAGVPAGAVTVSALAEDGAGGRADVTVRAGQSGAADVTLSAGSARR